MNDAWIGVVGAAIGALAGVLGGWMTHFLTSRRARLVEVREAVADLVATASLPTVVNSAVDANAIPRDELAHWRESSFSV